MAKYTEKGMYDKLSEFSNSKRKKANLKKYPDGGGLGKLTYTPYSLGFYSPLVSNPVYNPSQMLTYYRPHLFSNPSQGTFRTPIEISVGLPYDRTQAGLTNPALSLSDPSYHSISDYTYMLNAPNTDLSQSMYQDVADFLQKDVHDLTQADLNKYTAAKELGEIKPKYQSGLPIDAGIRYTIMGMKQNSESPVRGMLSLMGGYNPQSGFFGGFDAGAYGLLGNVSPGTYLKRGLEDAGEFMFTPSLNLAAGIRQNSGFIPDKEVVDEYLNLLQNDAAYGTRTAGDYYSKNLDADVENANFAIKPELKFEYRPFDKFPMNLEAVLGANIDLIGKRQGQMDQLIPGVAPYGRASVVFPLNQVKKSIRRIDIDMPNINWPELPERPPRERKPPKPCPEGQSRACDGCPCEPIEKVHHPRWLRDGGEYLTVDGEYHRVYKNADGDIMVNHPQENKGKWDTINLTDKADAKTVAQGVAATKKWHKENPLFKYIRGGSTCPEGFEYVNGECVPIVDDCEGEQCRETDQIQEIYNNALDIPKQVVDYEFGIEDLTNEKYAGNARLAWKSQGVKSFVEPSCMYVAGLGWRCAPATKDYISQFDPVNFNSNIGFIHAVDRGDLPFVRVGKFSDRNFDEQSKGNMRIGDVVNFKGADNSHAETFVGYREDGTPMYIDSNGNPSNYSTDSLWTPLRPNTTGKGKDYAYVNRFDVQRYVDDTYGDQIEELERQARENPTYYKNGGLTKFDNGGQYLSFLTSPNPYSGPNPYKPATVEYYEYERNKVLNNPLIPIDTKLKWTNGPMISNIKIKENLLVQKAKEEEAAKKKRLAEQQRLAEKQRQAALRQSGSDNTRVDNSYLNTFDVKFTNIFDEIAAQQEAAKTLTARQKQEANRIINSGDFHNLFPELNEEYLSDENSERDAPLTREELLLREMRNNPQFFEQYYAKKEKAWKKHEQEVYDNLSWWEVGLNNLQSFIADPILVTNNAILRGERPLVGQGEWSIDPDDWSDVDNYYFDKFSGKSKATFNNLFNYINVARAGAGAGESIRDGEYGQAVFDLATAIPMIKGAKYGWKALNAIAKTQPLKYIPGLAGTGISGMTTGQALAGYGMYHAGTENFPNAYKAYSEGDWKTGNEELFMGFVNAVPFVAEAGAGAPSVLQDISAVGSKIKQGYNTVAQGESVLPIAWKNPAANLDGAISETMFNKILQSDDFTPAEKAMLKEYQFANYPFTTPGPKQDAFNALIGKANLTFPEEAVVTRAFSNPETELQAFTGTADDIKTISMQDRPSAFSAGVSNKDKYYYGKTDRIVISGKNLKKVEGNFAKQRYEPLEEGYYTNIPDEELAVIDNSNRSGAVGDMYYGTQRLTSEELMAQAEAVYAEQNAKYTNPSNTWLQPPKDPNFLTGQPKSNNPADGVYSAEESAEIFTQQQNAYKENLRLFANPANKEEAIQKIISDASKQGYANKKGPVDELELFGSGFDMKVVGKFPNKTGGYDYVVQPRNIRSLKPRQSKDLNSVSQGNANSTNVAADANAGKQTSSNLEIAQKFDDTKNFSRQRITDVEEKRRILRENPDKIVTKYQDVWSNNDELSEVQDLFPFTREGQQQAFDEGIAFAKKWMTQDSQKFDEAVASYKVGNEELTQLDIKRATLENTLKLELNKKPELIDYDRVARIETQLEGINQRFSELQPKVYENLKIINENIDPQFRDKIATIYKESLGPNETMPNLEASQAEIHLGNLDEQAKLVQYGKYEPSYLELSQSDKNYLNENLFKTEGVNRAGDSSIEGNILTYGSKPQVLDEQPFFEIISKSGELSSDPEYVRFVGSFMKDPFEVATTNVHEVAGHQGQKMFGNWMGQLQEYNPEMLYEVPTDKNELAKLFKEALVEPVKETKLYDEGIEGLVKSTKTWQSSPQELYADVMIARYDLAKRLMKNYDMSLEEAILEIKSQVNNPSYNEWIANYPEVRQHFKPTASTDLKNQIIKYLPAVIMGVGYGVSQGANSETPKNKYGGNIKTLSKFIRK